MSENVVTSDKSALKKSTTVKKKAEPKAAKGLNERDKPTAVAPDGYQFIYFESGSGYITSAGFKFTKDKRINLVPIEEADSLLELPNFRLPNQLELEEYSKEI